MRIKALPLKTALVLLCLPLTPAAAAKTLMGGESTLTSTGLLLLFLSIFLMAMILIGVVLRIDAERRRRYEKTMEVGLQEMRTLMLEEISRIRNLAESRARDLFETKILNGPILTSRVDEEFSKKLAEYSLDFKNNIEDVENTFSQKLEVIVKTVAKQTKDLAESSEQQKKLINKALLEDRQFLTEAICIALLTDSSEERVAFLSEFLDHSSDAKFLLRLYEKSPQLSLLTVLRLTAKKLQMEEHQLIIQWVDELINLDERDIAVRIACTWIKALFELRGTSAQFDEIYQRLPSLKEQIQGFDTVNEFGDHLISRAALAHDVKRAAHEIFSLISSQDQLIALQEILDLINALLKSPAAYFTQNNQDYKSDQLKRTENCIQKALSVSLNQEDSSQSNLLSESLAALYVLQKNYSYAETVCRELFDGGNLTLENRSRYCYYLGALLAFQKKPEESETMLKKSIELLDNLSITGVPVLLTALERLAAFYTTNKDYSRAETLYKRVLELRHKASGQQNGENVEVLMKLGELYVVQKDLAQAEIFMESAADTALAIYSTGAKPLNEVLLRYSKLLSDLGKNDESKTILDKLTASK